MRKLKLIKVIASSLIVASILMLNPIGANAEWKHDSNGEWYTEGNSWATGWREINGDWYYFDSNGYMKTGWLQDGDNWYYFYSYGSMAKNTTIDGYLLGPDGVWIQFTIDQLVSILKAKGYTLEVKDLIHKDDDKYLIRYATKQITLDKENLFARIYNSNQEMEKDSLNISPNGLGYKRDFINGGGEGVSYSQVSSDYQPHWYKQGNIMIEYSGKNYKIISDLKDIFGEQFAGTNEK
jgi:hypothetical protein